MPDLKASLGSAMQAVPGGSTVAEATGFKEKGMFPGLSMKQRVKYFAYAFIGANVAYTLAFGMFFVPGLQKSAALFITMGTLGMLVATGMIVGPKKQMASMAKPQRAGCAAAFVFFFIATIYVTFTGGNFIIVAFCAVCQVASYLYYILSYIPYGRKGAQKLVKAAMG